MSGLSSEWNYNVHYYEIDSHHRLTVAGALRYFQDSAIRQSESVGRGFRFLAENNISWVVYKWETKVYNTPTMYDSVKVRTYPVGMKRTTGFRRFEMRNQADELLMEADSIWFLLDTLSRKPTKVPPQLAAGFYITPENSQSFRFDPIRFEGEADDGLDFRVSMSDIDSNRHVNNVRYWEWCRDALPNDRTEGYRLSALSAHFMRECKYGERVRAEFQEINESETKVFKHRVCSGHDFALFRSEWLPLRSDD